MSGSTAGLRPNGNGRWSAIVGSYVVRYTKHVNGSYSAEISAREDVHPRPNLIRVTLAPQPTLALARVIALQFVQAHDLAEDALTEAALG